MTEQRANDWPATWPAWVVCVAESLGETEGPLLYLVEEEPPEWVRRMAAELLKVMHPSLTVKDYQESGPRFLGELVGHQEVMLGGIEERLNKLGETLEQLDALLKAKLSKKAYRRMIEAGKKYEPDVDRFAAALDRVLAAKSERVKAAVNTANEQALNDKTEFFDGYSRALSTPIYDDEGKLTQEKLTTGIYFLMCLFWRRVREFPTTAVLHEWLTRLLGARVVGDLDRVRKICCRINLRLRPRGRPRKLGH